MPGGFVVDLDAVSILFSISLEFTLLLSLFNDSSLSLLSLHSRNISSIGFIGHNSFCSSLGNLAKTVSQSVISI